MRGMRVVVAGVIGGLVMFIWGFVSHMVLPIGEMGLESLPDEAVLTPAMKASINHRGFYLFPGLPSNPNEAEQKAFADKYTAGPRGILVYDPEPGVAAMSPQMLGIECGSNVVAAILGAMVLACVGGGVGKRVFVATMLGVIGWMSINVSYWNWFRFPALVTEAALIDQAVGWLVSGLVMAVILGMKKKAPRAA